MVPRPGTPACGPTARAACAAETPTVTLSFSELKYLFECPYQFKLRFLYGFNPPIHEALGYGKGLHDALAEVHKRALAGDLVGQDAAAELVTRHLHTPFAYPELRKQLERSAVESVERYLARARVRPGAHRTQRKANPGPRGSRHHGRRPHRPGSPAGHR